MHFGERRKNTTWAHQIASVAIFRHLYLPIRPVRSILLANPAVGMIKSIPKCVGRDDRTAGFCYREEARCMLTQERYQMVLAVMNRRCGKSFDISLAFHGRKALSMLPEVRDTDGNPASVTLGKGSYDKNSSHTAEPRSKAVASSRNSITTEPHFSDHNNATDLPFDDYHRSVFYSGKCCSMDMPRNICRAL